VLTTPVRGLESCREMLREPTENRDAIEVCVDVGAANAERPR
jgi:hypothetical protein